MSTISSARRGSISTCSRSSRCSRTSACVHSRSAASTCCCCSAAVLRQRPRTCRAARFLHTTAAARCTWHSGLGMRSSQDGRHASRRTKSLSRAAPRGRAAGTASISAIRTVTSWNWQRGGCGRSIEGRAICSGPGLASDRAHFGNRVAVEPAGCHVQAQEHARLWSKSAMPVLKQQRTNRPGPFAAAPIEERVSALPWDSISEDLDRYGAAQTGPVLDAAECASLAELYPRDEAFRSRIVMRRHGFGSGEYKYFTYPLPELIAGLRAALYERLAPI